MRGKMAKLFILSIGLVGVASSAALAAHLPDFVRIQSPISYPNAPKPVSGKPQSPYPMTYLDEAAQTLGVRNGHLDLFSSHPAGNNVFMPAVSGSVGSNGAMLRLQWHPGE